MNHSEFFNNCVKEHKGMMWAARDCHGIEGLHLLIRYGSALLAVVAIISLLLYFSRNDDRNEQHAAMAPGLQ